MPSRAVVKQIKRWRLKVPTLNQIWLIKHISCVFIFSYYKQEHLHPKEAKLFQILSKFRGKDRKFLENKRGKKNHCTKPFGIITNRPTAQIKYILDTHW